MKQISKAKQLKRKSLIDLKQALPNIIVIAVLIVLIRTFHLSFLFAVSLFFVYSFGASIFILKERRFKVLLKRFIVFVIFASVIYGMIKLFGGWGVWGIVLFLILIGGFQLFQRRKLIDEGTDMIVDTIREALNERKTKKRKN